MFLHQTMMINTKPSITTTTTSTSTSSNTNPTNHLNQSSSQQQCRHSNTNHDNEINESWIDQQLDYIRDHKLHPIIETIVAWIVAILCLIYYGYQYITSVIITTVATNHKHKIQHRIPLMTEVRQRHDNDINVLVQQVQQLYTTIIKSLRLIPDNVNGVTSTKSLSNLLSNEDKQNIISQIRSDDALRRCVSQYTMYMTTIIRLKNDNSTITISSIDYESSITIEMQQLYHFFDSIWMDLLRLPSDDEYNTVEYQYTISLIIPAYNELVTTICETLNVAMKHCYEPKMIQVIIVDAGKCNNLNKIAHTTLSPTSTSTTSSTQINNDNNQPTNQKVWGEINVVQYIGNGGRGSCQNYGTQYAKGKYLCFLHSDTLLPYKWDIKIQNTLQYATKDGTITHACSFSVGHNVSKKGLCGMNYPYGIRSILLLGNIRAWLFRLPYGDHILSFHTNHFVYIGGFPNQTIMEDYTIMDLLRQRATILPETLRIIPPPTGLCSVRRWQQYGVVYVTLVNALIVNRYVYGGWTADDVYDYYYLRPYKQQKKEQ